MAIKDLIQGNSFKWFIFPLVFTDLIVFDEVIDRIVAANGPFEVILPLMSHPKTSLTCKS